MFLKNLQKIARFLHEVLVGSQKYRRAPFFSNIKIFSLRDYAKMITTSNKSKIGKKKKKTLPLFFFVIVASMGRKTTKKKEIFCL
jgi:hypothetical protein